MGAGREGHGTCWRSDWLRATILRSRVSPLRPRGARVRQAPPSEHKPLGAGDPRAQARLNAVSSSSSPPAPSGEAAGSPACAASRRAAAHARPPGCHTARGKASREVGASCPLAPKRDEPASGD